jgi:hypothetical protein
MHGSAGGVGENVIPAPPFWFTHSRRKKMRNPVYTESACHNREQMSKLMIIIGHFLTISIENKRLSHYDNCVLEDRWQRELL